MYGMRFAPAALPVTWVSASAADRRQQYGCNSPATATGSLAASTGSSNAAGWWRAPTSLSPMTLPSTGLRQSARGCAFMSPRASRKTSAWQCKAGVLQTW